MKAQKPIAFLIAAVLLVSACKKDKTDNEDEEEIQNPEKSFITYNGVNYTIEKGREWTYKLNRYPSHNTFAYLMWNGTVFTPAGNYNLQPNDPPITLFYYLSLPASSGYMVGDFIYHPLASDWATKGLPESLKDKQVFTSAVVGFDANNDRKITPDEVIAVTGGTINYYGHSNVQYNLTLANGKTLKGVIKATMTSTNPPS